MVVFVIIMNKSYYSLQNYFVFKGWVVFLAAMSYIYVYFFFQIVIVAFCLHRKVL